MQIGQAVKNWADKNVYIYIYMVSILYRIVYSEKNKQLNYFVALKLNPAVPAHDLMEEYNLRQSPLACFAARVSDTSRHSSITLQG